MRKHISLLILLGLTLVSCVPDEAEYPPTGGENPNIEVTATIAELKSMYTGTAIQLDDSLVITGVVVADDESGNFYKSIVIQDATAGILIRMDDQELFKKYPVGRRLFIKLGGLWLGEYNGLIQLGGTQAVGNPNEVDYIVSSIFDKVILRGTYGNEVTPVDVTFSQMNSSYQNMLIRLSDVQFIVGDTNKMFAPGSTQNITLEDCGSNTVIVRTSSFATFAYDQVPNLNGEMVCIYSEFGTTKQLLIRDPSDLKMNDAVRCGPYAKKDFEDGSVTSGGWTVQQVTDPGTNWTTGTIGVASNGGTTYVKCSNYYSAANHLAETWLISPSLNFSAAINPAFSFINACNYGGANIQVKVSSDYVSGAPSSGTWSNITASLSSGSWTWVNSGALSLTSYVGQSNVHVAIVYTGSASDGKTWEIDNILIAEQ